MHAVAEKGARGKGRKVFTEEGAILNFINFFRRSRRERKGKEEGRNE